MQPLTVISGVLLGSTASIAFGLAVVAFIAMLLGEEAPQLYAELKPLAGHIVTFTLLTAICAIGFLGVLRRSRWRWAAQALMWGALLATGWSYWPEG